MKLKVLGVSSGNGVSLYPFKLSKYFEVMGNIELRGIFHSRDDDQWKLNFGDIPLIKKEFNPRHNGEHRKIIKKGVDVIISSPDCGSGSVLRYSRAKKLGNHQQNKSLSLFLEVVNYAQPKFFLLENLLAMFKTFPLSELREQLPGYRILCIEGSVSRFGNSQKSRNRLVLVGIKKDEFTEAGVLSAVRGLMQLNPNLDNPKSCKKIYGDLGPQELPVICHIREDLDEVISIYGGKKLSLREIKEYWDNNPTKTRWEVTDRKYSRAPGVYRNLSHSTPSTARKANRQYDHHGLTLTPRQLARIQGVPDEFKLWYNPSGPFKKNYYINKARATVTKTPPYEISHWFAKKLTKGIERGLIK